MLVSAQDAKILMAVPEPAPEPEPLTFGCGFVAL
jgi:hypothetical protein